MRKLSVITIICLSVLIGLSAVTVALADKGKTYSVTITNLTRKQVVTPPLVISHQSSYTLFAIGQPASGPLAALAEGGDTQPLTALLGTMANVYEFAVGNDPIMPGKSQMLTINAKGKFNQLTVAGMLASTNDAFFALNGVMLPREKVTTMYAVAYDAGSEANTELCEHIPGPPCGNLARILNGAEGFVHVHNGIHGVGDLNEAAMDWNNPVIEIVIERIDKGLRKHGNGLEQYGR